MSKYFMGDTRLAWLERMMMDPARPSPICTVPQHKRPQKKLMCNRPNKPRTCEQKGKGGSV